MIKDSHMSKVLGDCQEIKIIIINSDTLIIPAEYEWVSQTGASKYPGPFLGMRFGLSVSSTIECMF